MKTKKLLIMLIAVIVLGVGTLCVIHFTEETASDPLGDSLVKDNYPFNGYYSVNSITVTADALANKLTNIEGINKYTENIKTEIYADNSLLVSCTLKNISELFGTTKELTQYQMWASAFEGQEIAATINATSDENDNLKLELTNLKIGSVSLDPALFSGMIDDSIISQQIGTIPYNTVSFAEGQIVFLDVCPEFLK